MSTKLKKLTPLGIEITSDECEEIKNHVIEHGVVVIRHHNIKTRQDFIDFGNQFGEILEWDFGPVNELKVDQNAKNYLYSNEAVPFHWDGAFKLAPSLLLFHCLKAPDVASGGETLFTDTTKLYQALSAEEKALWQRVKLTYQTEKVVHYGGEVTTSLVASHPQTNEPILRFAEPVQTDKNPVSMQIDGLSDEEQQHFLSLIVNKIYDPQYCLAHQWQDNDILIADNHRLIHARKAFSAGGARHIRRIQLI